MPTAEELLSVSEVRALTGSLTRLAPDRDWSALAAAGDSVAAELGLRLRVTLVRDALLEGFPEPFVEVEHLIRRALLDPGFRGWRIWPVGEAMAIRATAAGRGPDVERGLILVAALTSRLTSEFALRIFLNRDLDRTLQHALRWTRSGDPDVRRLASEGTRPLLPWAAQVRRLRDDPGATLPILDALRSDPVEVVRRSVANHLNDISRLDPELAVATARGWLEAPAPAPDTARVVRQALRTLVKQADPGALALLGFGPTDSLRVSGPVLAAPQVAVGDALTFSGSVTNDSVAELALMIDYVMYLLRANGTHSPKVFKLTTRTIAPGEEFSFARSHSFRPITTRRHYPGEHALELQVNGRRHGLVKFELIDRAQ